MYAKLKSGKVLSGKLAEIFVRKGIAEECDEPVKKEAKKTPVKKEAKKTPVKKEAKKVK